MFATICRRCTTPWWRLAEVFESEEVIVTAGGSTYFDVVADVLTGPPSSGEGTSGAGLFLEADDHGFTAGQAIDITVGEPDFGHPPYAFLISNFSSVRFQSWSKWPMIRTSAFGNGSVKKS